MKRDNTLFKLWLMKTYMDHKEEANAWGCPTCDPATYFRMYKYWLKREFRHQQNNSGNQ